MEKIQWKDIPVIETARGGYFALYNDGRKIWHKNEFPSDYQPNLENDIKLPEPDEIDLVNQELNAISQKPVKLKPPSDFVIAGQDVKDGDLITFLDEGKYNTLPQDPTREVLTFKVKVPSGDEKSISVNKTSQIELIKAWTDDSKKWIGKEARVELIKQKVFDKTKEVIYLYPAEGKVASPTPEKIKK